MALNRNARYTGENDTEDQAQIKLDKIIATIQSQPHYKNPDGKISQDGREYLAFIEMLKKQGHKPTDILVSLELKTLQNNAIKKGDPELAADIRSLIYTPVAAPQKRQPSELAAVKSSIYDVRKADNGVQASERPRSAQVNQIESFDRSTWNNRKRCEMMIAVVQHLVDIAPKKNKEDAELYSGLTRNSAKEISAEGLISRLSMIHSMAQFVANSSVRPDDTGLNALILKAFPRVAAMEFPAEPLSSPAAPSPSSPLRRPAAASPKAQQQPEPTAVEQSARSQSAPGNQLDNFDRSKWDNKEQCIMMLNLVYVLARDNKKEGEIYVNLTHNASQQANVDGLISMLNMVHHHAKMCANSKVLPDKTGLHDRILRGFTLVAEQFQAASIPLPATPSPSSPPRSVAASPELPPVSHHQFGLFQHNAASPLKILQDQCREIIKQTTINLNKYDSLIEKIKSSSQITTQDKANLYSQLQGRLMKAERSPENTDLLKKLSANTLEISRMGPQKK